MLTSNAGRALASATVVAGLSALGCSDPTAATTTRSARGPARSLSYSPGVWADPSAPGQTPLTVGLFWKSYHDELWAYDNRAELGFTAHAANYYNLIASPLGGKIVRFDIYYPEGYATDSLISRLRSARANGLEAAVVYAPDVNTYVCFQTTDDEYRKYGTYIQNLIRAAHNANLKPPEYWQLFNEEDHPGVTNAFGGSTRTCPQGAASPGDQGINYARMLRIVYPMIKDPVLGDPAALVVVGGITAPQENKAFVQGIYYGGGKPFFDIMAVHSYGVRLCNEQDATAATAGGQKANEMRPILDAYQDYGRPIWLTEFGLSGHDYLQNCPSAHPSGAFLDQYQSSYWRDALGYHQQNRTIAQKIFVYGIDTYIGEPDGSEYPRVVSATTPRDYTYSLLTGDGNNWRPAAARAIGWNNSVNVGAPLTTDIDVNSPGKVPVGFSYTLTAGNGFDQIRILNVPMGRGPTKIQFASKAGANVVYNAHLAGYGWLPEVRDGSVAGVTGETRSLQATAIRLVNAPGGVSLLYRGYVQGQGWQGWTTDGSVTGTVGQGIPLQAIQVQLSNAPAGWRVCYQAHVTVQGWNQGPVCDGQTAGYPGSSLGMEAMTVWLVQSSN